VTAHPEIVAVMLGAAAGVTVLSCVGMAMMGGLYQRLHFVSPVVSVAAFLTAGAVWVSGCEIQAGVKATLIALTLFVMNGVLGHTTARAARVKTHGRWTLESQDKVLPEARDEGQEPVGGRDGSH
jgi:multisubunit Na+/H+ antiporter MnhG subunit